MRKNFSFSLFASSDMTDLPTLHSGAGIAFSQLSGASGCSRPCRVGDCGHVRTGNARRGVSVPGQQCEHPAHIHVLCSELHRQVQLPGISADLHRSCGGDFADLRGGRSIRWTIPLERIAELCITRRHRRQCVGDARRDSWVNSESLRRRTRGHTDRGMEWRRNRWEVHFVRSRDSRRRRWRRGIRHSYRRYCASKQTGDCGRRRRRWWLWRFERGPGQRRRR